MFGMTDPLRAYWDFDDPDASEARFLQLQAEIQTQLARVKGMREDFDGGDRLLDEITDGSPRVRIRVDLERGRLRRSSGDKEAALPLFERAFEAAIAAGEDWLAGDAAHMCALAAPDRAGFVAWTKRGLMLARSSADAAYWEGPLLNNLGWDHLDAGEHQWALELFEQALVVRERDPSNQAAIQLAREAVAEARKALGRS
jgi:tetratricopeptide (TPR) repeat protein